MGFRDFCEQISLYEERLAENLAELGLVSLALRISQDALRSSLLYLMRLSDQVDKMKKLENLKIALIEDMKNKIVQYAQHVQSHIITMTDFAVGCTHSLAWKTYEEYVVLYFEKMQQLMQAVECCDELLCKHDQQRCVSASAQAALDNCMYSDFDPDQFD